MFKRGSRSIKQLAFTLIELVMVIVILGILAAVAVPKYISLEGTARQAAVDGVGGALGSSSVINYAARSSGDTVNTYTITNCTDYGINPGPLQGGIPAGYTITAGVIGAGAAVTCTVTRAVTLETATFTGLGIA